MMTDDGADPSLNSKIPLWEMAASDEAEAERIDTWERLLRSEGTPLPAAMAYRRLISQRRAQVIALVMENEAEFVRMVRARRQARGRAAADRRGSTAS